MRQKEVLLIIPAYNEEKNIEKVMKQLAQPEIADIVDVLVMNDASSDNTNWLAKEYGCAVVTHVFNLGYGSGLQLGYKYAIRRKYKYVIQMDADGQHDVCNIPKIYERLRQKDADGRYPDIVLGSRFMEGSSDFPVSVTKKLAYALFRQMIKQWKETGQDIYFDMVIENDDQESSAGKQSVLLIDCNLDSVVLGKLDGDSDDPLDEDVDFTFEDFDILTPFTQF